MRPQPQGIYEFGEFRLDASRRMLFRGGATVPLTPKVFDTLLHLVRHQGEVIGKEELLQAVWPDTAVEENNLNQNISALRRIFGESRGEHRYIGTVPGKGYHFIPTVEIHPATTETNAGGVIVAVLPFHHLGSLSDREYLADGLTEEVIATLGQIDPSHISVIGRTTMMAYKATRKTLAEIGGELDAAYLIESSMRSEGDRVRITSNLVRVPDQLQIWSMTYDSQPSSMLQFQREVSLAIGEQVRLRLSPERLSALGKRQTNNAEAYDLYLRGRYFWHQLSPQTTRRATEFYSRATAIDPQYALAWSGLADAYAAAPINGDAPPLVVGPLARSAAENAIRSGPKLAESHTSAGFVKFWIDWQWRAAEMAFRHSIEADPNYSLAYRMLGITLSHLGRHDEAAAATSRARELDPLLAGHHALSAQVAFGGRDFDLAARFARQSITLDPEFWVGYIQLAQALEQLGEGQKALDALNDAGRLSGGNSKTLALRGYVLAKSGRREDALEVMQLLDAAACERYIPPYAWALIHLGMGEYDHALERLQRAKQTRDVHVSFLYIDPKWDPLRADPRFAALLEECGCTA